MFKKFGIGLALLGYLSVISGAVLIVGGVFYLTSEKAMNQLMSVSQSGTGQLALSNSMIKSMALVHSNILPLAAETDADSIEIRMELVKGFISEFDSQVKKCGAGCEVLTKDITKYKTEWEETVAHIAKKDQPGAAKNILNELNPIAEAIFDKLDKAASEVSKTTTASLDEAAQSAINMKHRLLGMILALVATIIGFGFFFQRKLVSSIQEVVQKVDESVGTTMSKTEEISSSSTNLSQAATRQAASIEETVASLEEMSSMVKRNAEHAKTAADFSKQSTAAASEGGKEISILITSMREISTSSKKIEEIIAVIDDIAFQTNLLALNAAVEAARAGEQGKGFAVVAEAVRSLAQRSAEAAKQIGGIIKASVEQTEKGTKVADNSGAALNKIIDLIQKLDALNNEISVASQEQAMGIGQLSKAMTEIDQVTQTNANIAENLSSNSQALLSEAGELQNSTKELNTLLKGQRQAEAASHDTSHASSHAGEAKAS